MPQCVGYHRVLLHLKPYLGLVFCLDKAGDLLIISFVFPVSFLVDLLIQFHAGMQAKKGVGLLGNMFRESEINCLGGCGSGGGLATYIPSSKTVMLAFKRRYLVGKVLASSIKPRHLFPLDSNLAPVVGALSRLVNNIPSDKLLPPLRPQ